MVTKRIRSEYMKKFKDPKWETYSRCYEEMLKYRLTRRLLEHTHNPWFWSGSDSDSDSGGKSPPPPCTDQVQCEGQQDVDPGTSGPVPRLRLQEEGEEQGVPAGSQTDVVGEERASSSLGKRFPAPHREQNQVRDTGQQQPQQSKSSKPSKQTVRSRRVRPAPSRQPREDSKESKHTFALYGSGEKNADIGARKTHNVGPVASTNEIHESALRAKTRRQVERQIQTQATERRRAKSVDLDKARKPDQPEFNPWLTEYMRCFSARLR